MTARITRLLAPVACAAALVPVATAEAKAPPNGRYACTISGNLFGTLYITGAAKYRYDAYDGRGKPGRFASSGRKLTFKTGPLKKMKGRWYIAKGNGRSIPEIALRNPRDNFESIYCTREG
jgi:hypothetical protein